ncbi:hypothetical protein QT615_22635, partial [Xanthomonas citri pv. citri]
FKVIGKSFPINSGKLEVSRFVEKSSGNDGVFDSGGTGSYKAGSSGNKLLEKISAGKYVVLFLFPISFSLGLGFLLA